jgi:hypothetical protein
LIPTAGIHRHRALERVVVDIGFGRGTRYLWRVLRHQFG